MAERFQRGLARQQEIGDAGPRQRVYDALADIAPDLSRLAVEFAYGDIHSRPGLDASQRELVIVGTLIATGGVDSQLEAHLAVALSLGLPPPSVVEAIIQTIPYVGFPRVFAAMTVARRVFVDRGLLPLQP